MGYTCIYEALPNKLITLPFVLLTLAELFLGIYSAINWKKNNVSGKIGMCIIFVLLLFVIICMVYNYCSSYIIWNTYKNDDCFVAEGVIENYVVGTDEKLAYPDRFTVSDIYFIVSNSPASGYGYTLRQYDGGVLRDGLYCKIFYIPYKNENVIMKILILENSG